MKDLFIQRDATERERRSPMRERRAGSHQETTGLVPSGGRRCAARSSSF